MGYTPKDKADKAARTGTMGVYRVVRKVDGDVAKRREMSRGEDAVSLVD